MYPPGRHSLEQVLDVLIKLFNTRPTALSKSVSHKNRFERPVPASLLPRPAPRGRLPDPAGPAQPRPAPHPGDGSGLAE